MPYSTKTSAEKTAQAEAIAAALGDGWVVSSLTEGERDNEAMERSGRETYVGRELAHRSTERAERYSLRLEWDGSTGKAVRLEIRGRWPSTFKGEVKTAKDGYGEERRRDYVTTITVDASRAVDKIAGEIRRRLLPDYLKAFAVAMGAVERSEAYQLETEATLARLVEAGGRQSVHQGTHAYLAESHADGVSASGTSVRFEAFSCPIDVALRIIEAARRPAAEAEAEAAS